MSFRRPFPLATVGCVAFTLACSVACGSSDSSLFGNHGGLDAALPAFGGWGGTSSNGGAPGSGSVTSDGGNNGGGGLAASGGTSGFGGAVGRGGSAIDGGRGRATTEAGAGGADGGGNPEAGSGGNAGSGGAIGSGGNGGSGGAIGSGGNGGSGGAIGSGGAASGGKGGSGGAIGSGGIAGSGGAGGGGGVLGSGGAAGNPSAGFVRCGDGSCDKSKGLVCCVRTVAQGTTAACVKDTSTCDNVFACDGNSDCKAGTQCCLDYTNAQSKVSPDTACLTTCNNGGPFQCSGPADCPGQECCGTGIALSLIGTYYTSVVCQTSCASASTGMAAYELCDANTVCAQNNTTCQQSASFPPGYRVCK